MIYFDVCSDRDAPYLLYSDVSFRSGGLCVLVGVFIQSITAQPYFCMK
jgi:hypothetical protein